MERMVLDFLTLLEYGNETTVGGFLYSFIQVLLAFGFFLMICKMIFKLIESVIDWRI